MPNQQVRYSDFPLAFQLGLSRAYKDELQLVPKTYSVWLREEPAERFVDVEWATAGFGMIQSKPIGQAVGTDVVISGKTKTFTLRTFGLGAVVQHEVLAWDLYGIFKRIPSLLAKSSVDRYNLEAYALWGPSAFATTDPYYQTFQLEPIVKLAHTRIDGGTWKNRPTINLGLSYLALQQAKIDIRRLVNERGRYVTGISMERIITSPEQEWVAREIIGSTYRVDNANMQKNLLADDFKGDAVHTSPFITSQLPFFVTCSKSAYSIRMRTGEEPDFKKEPLPGTRSELYTTYCSFRLDVFDSRGIWGSSGDGATST